MEVTLKDLVELAKGSGDSCCSEDDNDYGFKVDESYFIRTITMHHVGRVTEITDKAVIMEDASWVADSGRFGEALSVGMLNEVEPFPDPVIIPLHAIVDATIWRHKLPREAK